MTLYDDHAASDTPHDGSTAVAVGTGGTRGADQVRASLVVLNYNGADVIDPCLDSLVCGANPRDEIIVVDNASTDGSLATLQQRTDIRLISLANNTYIFGLNDGLRAARGEFVAFLNNDIVVEPNFVDRCIERFADGLDVFAVCPRVVDRVGAEQGSRTAAVWRGGMIFYQPLPHSKTPTDCFFAVGGQSFFRTAMLDEIGSIDPLLRPMYHEDIELSYRAWKRGWRVRYEPDAIAHHVGGHTSGRVFSRAQLRSFVRQNEYLIVWKNITDPSLVIEHLLLVIPRLITAAVKRDWPTIVGFSRAVRRLPTVRSARANAKCHARLHDREVLRRTSSIR
jgi:GT2 family glycosyltransferase